MSETAWHWVGDTLRDGRPIPGDGETLVHDGPVEMCRSGLHASRRVLDALQYTPGSTVCRVEVAGVVDEDDDKLVARQRTILWRVDADEILRDFARRCALDVIHLWDAPDVVREYLETGDESLRVAAGTAAMNAAWNASRGRTRSAAWDATRAAAARSATAWTATAWSATAWTLAEEKQNRRLTAMISARRER